jgi:hypothetical protein
MVHLSFHFDFGQQKKRLCFSVTKNTAASKLPIGYWLYEIVYRTDSGLKRETPRFLVKKRGASMKNKGFEFFIQNPRQAA